MYLAPPSSMNSATFQLIELLHSHADAITFRVLHEARKGILLEGANPTIVLRELNTLRPVLVEFLVVEMGADWLARPHPNAATTLELFLENWTEWIGSGGPLIDTATTSATTDRWWVDFKRSMKLVRAHVPAEIRTTAFRSIHDFDVLYGFIDFPIERILEVVRELVATGADAGRMREHFDSLVAMGLFVRPRHGRMMTLYPEEIEHIRAMLGPPRVHPVETATSHTLEEVPGTI